MINLEKLPGLWRAWEAHPQFTWYYEGGRWPQKDAFNLLNPMALGVFEHAPGLWRQTNSYLVTTLQNITPAQIAWGKRTLGDWQGVEPIPSDIYFNSDFIQIRIAFISYSFSGGGQKYHSRQAIKQLLPRKFHRIVSEVRKHNAMALQRKRKENPYRFKYDRWLDRSLYKDDFPELEEYITLKDFWDVCIGKHHPAEVKAKVRHQLSFDILAGPYD